MITDWQLDDLITLIRRRYPAWDGFDHPPFVADEIEYKQATIARARDLLSAEVVRDLLAEWRYDELINRLERLGKDNNLLWNRVPSQGDLAILSRPGLDKGEFCLQMEKLLYGPRPTPERVQAFATYTFQHNLPNKWTFATYFLFVTRPGSEYFVKPEAARWFLKFVGLGDAYTDHPTAGAYATLREQAYALQNALHPYGPRDMVDVQSVLWVCFRESKARTGRLDLRGQVELDVPPTIYETKPTAHIAAIRESEASYSEEGIKVETEETALAEPLSQIFKNREEAEWAFNLLKYVIERVGRDDPNYALTIPAKHNGNVMRLNFGRWPILNFIGPDLKRIGILLKVGAVDFDEPFWKWGNLSHPEDGFELCVHSFSAELMKEPRPELKRAYEEALDYAAGVFKNWTATPYRRHHHPKIFEAIFDNRKRNLLFRYGLDAEFDELSEEEQPEVNEQQLDERPENIPYDLEQFAEETGFSEEEIAHWVRAVERKKQIVFYGPPGTGKTFVAEKLAQHLVGGGDGVVDLVQFHPAYQYEDFMQGIRPVPGPGGNFTYEMVPGRFLQFCNDARQRDDTCVLIIDEINRANLARVFGELMYLLEYRDRTIPLAGGGAFSIPGNVRIIGTMNTADRSIALVDHALRRRFAFIALRPNFDVLRRYHDIHDTGFPVEALITTLRRLNDQIGDPHYAVGITFFLRPTLADDIGDVWQMEIEPYLEELFFDRPKRLDAFRWTQIQNQILP